ncbi:MAG: site-specific integrase [Pelosinus sp.]|nr:site-specific integrase [Pelosinus sp.]
MATVRIEKRSKKAFTLIIDHGIDPISQKRKKETRTLETDDINIVEAERLKILAELAEGNYKPTSKSTVEEYFDYWFETPLAQKLDPKTKGHYKTLYDSRIKSWIGDKKLIDLTRDDLQRFYQRMIEAGQIQKPDKDGNPKPFKPISKTTMLHYHRLIRRVLNYALIEDEIIKKNVATRLVLPDPAPQADYDPDEELVKVLSQDEIIKLEIEAANTPHGNLVAVALRTGMRREELLALTRRKRRHYLYKKSFVMDDRDRIPN